MGAFDLSAGVARGREMARIATERRAPGARWRASLTASEAPRSFAAGVTVSRVPVQLERLSVDAARRIALTAQGFGDSRPAGRVDARQIRSVIDHIGVLQLDSVNVLCRSHYLPVFGRIGPYPRTTLDRMAWGKQGRELFEYWAHRTSLLPLSLYPLLRWRMQAAASWVWDRWSSTTQPPADWSTSLDPVLRLAPWAVIAGMTRLAKERPSLVDEVLALVTEHGPIAAVEADPDGRRRRRGDPDPDPTTGRMWNWQDGKIALEWLFYMGKVTTATRRTFERIYDLTERVIPAEVLAAPAPSQDDAQRELVRIAARAQGVSTEKQLREYFHLPADHSKARIAELVDAGNLIPARVEGVPQRMYLWHNAREPREVRARALLSPFDSLIWDRDRAQRLFDFHFRISIYTPAARRTHGYYVLPFLLGDRFVARVDLKADRQESTLRVEAANAEPGVVMPEVAVELADELRVMAGWLGLDRMVVAPRGDLSGALARATRTSTAEGNLPASLDLTRA
jgi:uncharacterized protein